MFIVKFTFLHGRHTYYVFRGLHVLCSIPGSRQNGLGALQKISNLTLCNYG